MIGTGKARDIRSESSCFNIWVEIHGLDELLFSDAFLIVLRCRVGENWWYRGEHCEEYVSEPLVVGIAIASVAGFLLVASGVIFFLARTLRDQYDKDESEDPIR